MSTQFTVREVGTLIDLLTRAQAVGGIEVLFDKLTALRTELQLVEQETALRVKHQKMFWNEINYTATKAGLRLELMSNDQCYIHWPDGYKAYCIGKHEAMETIEAEGKLVFPSANTESSTSTPGENV